MRPWTIPLSRLVGGYKLQCMGGSGRCRNFAFRGEEGDQQNTAFRCDIGRSWDGYTAVGLCKFTTTQPLKK